MSMGIWFLWVILIWKRRAMFRGRTWYCRDGAAETWGKICGF